MTDISAIGPKEVSVHPSPQWLIESVIHELQPTALSLSRCPPIPIRRDADGVLSK